MTSFPALTGREVVKLLRRAGFQVIRVKGSHHFLRHQDGRTTVVPVHSGETLGPGQPTGKTNPLVGFHTRGYEGSSGGRPATHGLPVAPRSEWEGATLLETHDIGGQRSPRDQSKRRWPHVT